MPFTHLLLAISVVAVWLPTFRIANRAMSVWPFVFACAFIGGLWSGYLTPAAFIGAGLLLAAIHIVRREKISKALHTLAVFATLVVSLALALHLLPGFDNPRLAMDLVFSADSVPFTQYANFDKALVGIFLLALVCERCATRAQWGAMLRKATPVFGVTVVAVMGLAMLAGMIGFDPKIPAYAPVFLVVNLLFTCVAEEAFFRGFLQERLSRSTKSFRWSTALAVTVSAALFAAAHFSGGAAYMAITFVLGLGCAVAYSISGRVEAPILVHFLVNAVHFFGFSYPRLA
jgi:uncharacterized protein